MTDKEERKLIKEYQALRAEYKKGHDRMVVVKKRMAEITRTVIIRENMIDERPDETILKDPYSR